MPDGTKPPGRRQPGPEHHDLRGCPSTAPAAIVRNPSPVFTVLRDALQKARLGPAGANTATAHKLAALIYHLLKYKEAYIDVDRLVYENKLHRVRLSRLRKQAEELGLEIVERKAAA